MNNIITLGIDIGGTKISAACVKKADICSDIIKLSTPKISECIIREVSETITYFKKQYDIKAVGIATAGVVDTIRGKVLSATENLATGYSGVNYKDIITNEFNLIASVDNDANAAAFAEHKYGVAQRYENAVIITLGTGIGSGLIINNSLYRSKNYAAGECGHIIIEYKNGRKCTCGKKGCWEAYASGTGMTTTIKELALKELRLVCTEYPLAIDDALKGIEAKDKFYIKVFDLWHEHIAAGLIGLINVLAPECIVLGGGMATVVNIPKLKEMIKDKSPAKTDLLLARFSNNAGIIGSAVMAEDEFNKSVS